MSAHSPPPPAFSSRDSQVTTLPSPVGGAPTKDQITKALKEKKYKVSQPAALASSRRVQLLETHLLCCNLLYQVLTFTHVDTSTGVLSDAKMIAQLVKEISPETIVVLDGVCSIASEEIRFDDWGIDIVVLVSSFPLQRTSRPLTLVASIVPVAPLRRVLVCLLVSRSSWPLPKPSRSSSLESHPSPLTTSHGRSGFLS